MGQPDYLILCLSQPSLSARDERLLLAALQRAGEAGFAGTVTAIRLEGAGTGLPDALRIARDAGARRMRVQLVGFPMAANMMAWLPGAVAHFAANEARGMEITFGGRPDMDAAAAALVALSMTANVQEAGDIKPSLGKPGWQFLPDFVIHILVCSGPRCAFRGAGTLQARLKARLAAEGLSDRCLTTTTGCLYPCNQGPMLALYPQGDWFHVPDEAALDRIVTQVIGLGGDAPELRLAERPGSRRDRVYSHPDRSVTCL